MTRRTALSHGQPRAGGFRSAENRRIRERIRTFGRSRDAGRARMGKNSNPGNSTGPDDAQNGPEHRNSGRRTSPIARHSRCHDVNPLPGAGSRNHAA